MPTPSDRPVSEGELLTNQSLRTSAPRPEYAAESSGPTVDNQRFQVTVEETPIEVDINNLSSAIGPSEPTVGTQAVRTGAARPPYAVEGEQF